MKRQQFNMRHGRTFTQALDAIQRSVAPDTISKRDAVELSVALLAKIVGAGFSPATVLPTLRTVATSAKRQGE